MDIETLKDLYTEKSTELWLASNQTPETTEDREISIEVLTEYLAKQHTEMIDRLFTIDRVIFSDTEAKSAKVKLGYRFGAELYATVHKPRATEPYKIEFNVSDNDGTYALSEPEHIEPIWGVKHEGNLAKLVFHAGQGTWQRLEPNSVDIQESVLSKAKDDLMSKELTVWMLWNSIHDATLNPEIANSITEDNFPAAP